VADKTGLSGAAGRAPEADRTDDIRNVVLVGHSGSGKTTLTEQLFACAQQAATGTATRAGRVEDGTTISDFDEIEARQQRSVNLTSVPFEYAGIKVNLLDAPGYADFVGDLRAGLRAADAALFVIAATDGVDGITRLLWEECASVGMPRAVVITKVDHQRADFDDVLLQCQDTFGGGVAPIYLPVGGGTADESAGATGLLGLLTQRYFDYASGERTTTDPPEAELARLYEQRGALIEGIITESEDETLMDRYLGGAEIDADVLIGDLEKAVARGGFFPVLPASAPHGIGLVELLELIAKAFPSPLEHPFPEVTSPDGAPARRLACDPDGPLLAEVVKTTSDPYVGRVSLVRVFSGRLTPDTVVHVSGHGPAGQPRTDHNVEEKVGALTCPLGKHQRPLAEVRAGDVCAVAKLSRAETGDTLSGKQLPLLMSPWTMPEPLLPSALQAVSKADDEKMSQALARLTAEDPTLHLDNNPETGQLVLWCMGEAHLDVALDRLKNRYGVEVRTCELRVPLRETFGGGATGTGRNVKQTGGHGEYGICHIEVEPLPSGAGFEFVDKIVGGVIPRQFIPSVEKGVRAQMSQGVTAGYPVVDLRVTVTDGKAHSVDSSDMAFQKAGRMALKDAADHASAALLEPVDDVAILVDDDYVGAVMSDLSARRGRVLGTEPLAGGRTLVKAEVPELEITRYAIDLRSMSHGTGSFTRAYLRHEPLPGQLAARFAAEAAD